MRTKTVVLQLDFDDLVDILANFFMVGSYWCSLIDWEEKDYQEAKTLLQLRMEDEDICQEHVWAEMLFNQKPLKLSVYEKEDESDPDTYELTYGNICIAIGHLINNGRLSSDLNDWDGYDCDNIIQQAIFGDVIYG